MSDGPPKNRNPVSLKAAKRELLSLLLEKEGIEFHGSKQIHPRQDRHNTPLSFGQERLWFLDQLEPGSSVYNLCRAQRLKGPLDAVALERGLNEIVSHHEILRTTFPAADGRPVQIITPTLTLSLPLLDLQHLSSRAREVEAARIINKEARYAFDLNRGPLVRVALLRLGREEYVLVLTMHQIVCDGWSMHLLFRAIERAYEAIANGRPVLLPELSIHYGDYAQWQRQRLQGEILESQLSYWKHQLAGMSSITELPGDRSRPEIQRFEGKRKHLAISDPVSRALKELCQQENVTLFVALLAAFYVLLHRYTEQEDITVGSPWTNRQHPQIQNLVGFFVNTLVLRAYVSKDFTFRELVREVRHIFLAAIAHQELPFETLVEEFQQVRDLSRNPLFQVMFAFQNFAAPNLALAGLTAEAIDVDTGTSKFDLTLSLAERVGQLYGFFEYNTDLFDHSTIERMVEHFQTLLESIVANPDQRISDLPILTEMERHQLLVEWNDTASDYPKDFCIHELVEAQVERTPKAIAVQFEGMQLTYRELNSRANQLAHYLRRLGVGPEKLVGICLERSVEMVIGLLGTLKAGGAYVPLDPSYPRERLGFMLQDAQVSVLITQEKLFEDRGWGPVLSETEGMEDSEPWFLRPSSGQASVLGPQMKIVCLDKDWEEIAQQREENPEKRATAQNLAYVIYTSGSTGKPKGVEVSHRSLVNCLHSMAEWLEFTDQDVLLAVTTISFDIAALELYLPLLVGGKVVMASLEDARDGRELVSPLTECSATAMQATPSTWRLLVDAGWDGSPGFKILCGGESMSNDLAEALLKRGEVWNLYGPTETTIWSTAFKVKGDDGAVFIGRPTSNTRIYVLDSHLQIVPIGVYGEIYIGGDGLARGYLNRPELTAERFVLNPFSDQPNSFLYRTGDRARYRPDGNIEFLGRLDNQVKIRGHRVELGEIESALNQHPSVKESVVIASSFPPPGETVSQCHPEAIAEGSRSCKWQETRDSSPAAQNDIRVISALRHSLGRGRIKVGVTPLTNSVGEETPLSVPLRLRSGQAFPVEGEGVSESDRNLIAYLVATTEKPLATELRRFLKEKLPDYMIPSVFVFLNALPLMPNGKIDRNALPSPDGERPLLDQGFVEPRTELEELVAQIWREVLKLDKIGIHDNFFDLGGHSLLATRVVARLRNNFSIDLPLRKLFELPTVAGLAEHLDLLRRNQGGVSVPPIVPVRRDRAFPLSFSQRRLWFLQKLDPDLTAYNIPATFRITGPLSIPALEVALNEIIKRHEVLRTRIIEIDGQPFQEIVPNIAIKLAIVDLSHLPQDQAAVEAERLSAEDARQPHNLSEASLMRAKLLRLQEQVYVLILNFHHIVCDGSSLIIFYQELAALYQSFLEGKVCNLPSLPVQYVDYSVWQHELLEREALAAQLAHWKRQLGTGLPTLNLPTDYERPAVQTYNGARVTKVVSEEVTKALKELSRREGVTLFMTLLATLDVLLARHTGQDDIVVGSTIAGRNRPEIDSLIGFFINALALRADLSGNPAFLEVLKRVREACLDAYTHQDLPFERVVEEINPQRDLSRNPLFQIMLNMADTSERVLKLAGCQTVKLLPTEPEAKFDIVFHAPEVDGKLELAIVYNADLFSERRIVNLLDQLTHLLSQVSNDPQKGIDEFSLVTPSAVAIIPDPTESLDNTWEGSIHELFARQAERAPDFPVVIDSDNCWTYRQLDQRSNQLANYLIAQGIKPKDVVTIYAQRSAALVFAILGILKAGGVFAILDPSYPMFRLISYLRITRPRALLYIEGAGETAAELKDFVTNLGPCCQLTILNKKVSSDNDTLKAYSALDPNIPIQADDPAYVAFTSGSTGEPKGVLSWHGPITHFLPWQREAFGLMQTDRFALLSGLAYNHLHRDIFTALYLGATLSIPKAHIARSPEQLVGWLQENEITVVHLTPALAQLLLTAGEKTLPAIRWVLFGGDVLTWREVAQVRQVAPNAKIGSFYGATETQRAVGYFQIPDEFPFNETNANRAVPLGRGIKDVQLLLLNKAGQLAGVGELAELYVRSPHLAEGYAGDETLTRERFLRNPFTSDATDRLYRTGELGRYLPDGKVEWAGRHDRCVNIRGFRVELEEIESVLKKHPTVSNAAVVLQDYEILSSENLKPETRNQKPDHRLVAYIVAEEEQQSLVDLLHSYVSTRLPDYMVPSLFLVLDRLPLTPNGKVDYQGLPPADRFVTGQIDSFLAPRNDVEAKLCEIFLQVLGIQQVGVNDNFFRLGGHSLLAAQAVARIKEACGVELELRTFLESPTVTALAKVIEVRLKDVPAAPMKDETDREEIEL